MDRHVPRVVSELLPLEDVAERMPMQLALGLTVRDPDGLQSFIKEVSDPQSANFRHYLTPAEFTARFGPTEEEYQAVIRFAQANGLEVTGTHENRLVLDVAGTAADVQRAFHVRLHNFRHPTENRIFFAPDSEPTLDVPVAIGHVSGLTNYWIPRPQSRRKPLGQFEANAMPRIGSGPQSTYAGNDFRAAYVPGTSLTGAGQAVGLVQFDGYNPNDITSYETAFNLPNVPLQNVLVGGFSGHAGTNNGEVCLDIQMAIAMAPGLSKVLVYEASNMSPWEDILSQMANDNLAKQLSCSWGGGPPSSTAEQIFMQMAAQGQTFFNASGDDNALTGSIPFPSDSPNIIQVGGTGLATVSPGGAWSSEAVWNWSSNTGSSGGFSNFYSIPPWQQSVSMITNQGSTSFRNFPDVALTADNIYTISDNGRGSTSAGTSCAAPLWAGFTALVNQQATNNAQPPVGFINPIIYQLGQSNLYGATFHDITVGNNITRNSNGMFSAVAGYDLCTGWGTPAAPLISALVSPGSLVVNVISASANPTDGGTITGASSYLSGTNVTLTATPKLGFAFVNWTENGNIVSTSPSYSFTANGDRTLVANFSMTATVYTITVSGTPANQGSVSGGGSYLTGSQAAAYAIPKRKYAFVNWTENGVVVSTDAYYTFTVDHNRNLLAQFGPKRARNRRHR